jgi:DNA-binding MarR family transcriptional regulator
MVPYARVAQDVRALLGALSQSARAVEERTGLTNAQLFLLTQLVQHGPLSVNELAARVKTGQSTVSIVAGRLERAGLVERTRSETDRRRVMLRASRAGQRLLKQVLAPPLPDLRVAIEALTPSEYRALTVGLRALLRALGVSARGARAAPELADR